MISEAAHFPFNVFQMYMKNSSYFLTQNLSAERERELVFEKWSRVYICGLIINIKVLPIVLNVNPFWLYLSSHFTAKRSDHWTTTQIWFLFLASPLTNCVVLPGNFQALCALVFSPQNEEIGQMISIMPSATKTLQMVLLFGGCQLNNWFAFHTNFIY